MTFYDDHRLDSRGRRPFMLDWKDSEGRPRGQCFFAVPEEYEKRHTEAGDKIIRGEAPWRKEASTTK